MKTLIRKRAALILTVIVAVTAASSLCYVSKSLLDRHYRKGHRKEFLALHSTNNPSDWGTAKNNSEYLAWNRNAGAHVVVDDIERYQCADFSWSIPAVGGKAWTGFLPREWLKGKILNQNSISWEMCLGWNRDNTKIVEQTAAEMGFALVTYGLEIGSVVRHHDAKGKFCPFFGQLYLTEEEWDEFYKNPSGSGYWDQTTEDVLFWKFKLRVQWYQYGNLLRLGKITEAQFLAKMNEPEMKKWGVQHWQWPEYPVKGIERPIRAKKIPG